MWAALQGIIGTLPESKMPSKKPRYVDSKYYYIYKKYNLEIITVQKSVFTEKKKIYIYIYIYIYYC